MHPARRLWASLEPLHDVVYFAPTVRDTGRTLGLRGYWMTYFAFRAAPLGAVAAGPVLATFAGFEPSMVVKALPDAWTRTTPAACVAARLEVSSTALRGLVDEQACAEVVPVLAPVLTAADPTGRALYAANAALPLPADEVAALWQLATTLREHRGDGHVAALVATGVTGLEALLLQVGAGRFPAEALRTVRGWSVAWWEAAATGLRERDLLTGDGSLTAAGRALLDDIEARTDAASWNGCLAALGEEVDRLVEVLAPSVRAVWSSGILPEVNPTGLPPQTA